MKEILNDYIENVKYFLKSKKYMISVFITVILSYGFILTHYSIGIDDLCFSRYIKEGFWLAADRWGSVLLYKIFTVSEYSPIWLEIIVVLLITFLSIIISSILKKLLKKEISIWYYAILSCIIISCPIWYTQLVYQTSSLTNVISNLAVIIIVTLCYENYYKIKDKKFYILLAIILPFFISMYESCCQTYLVCIFILSFISVYNEKKNIFKCIAISLIVLGLGITFNYVINNCIKFILSNHGLLEKNYAYTTIYWKEHEFKKSLIQLKTFSCQLFSLLINYKYVIIVMAFDFILVINQAIEKRKVSYLLIFAGICLSNFLINLAQLRLLYRINISYAITLGFLIIYPMLLLYKTKYINKVLLVLCIFIILYQSRIINNKFYYDNIRYERDKAIGFSIIKDITDNVKDLAKPIIYIFKQSNYNIYDMQIFNIENGDTIFNWGGYAFDEEGIEITNFLNSLGYNFKEFNESDRKEAFKQYSVLSEEEKSKDVIETEDYIIVSISEYY